MKIDLHNYEAFLLDYIEGNLNDSDRAELLLFLEANPQLQVDLEGVDEIIVTPDEILPRKGQFDFLKKPETGSIERFDELAVRLIEGEATPAEASELHTMISADQSLEKAWKAFQLTKLQAPAMGLENKADLYRFWVPQHVFDEMAVAALEGELSEKGLVQFNTMLQKEPDYQKQWLAYQQTKLRPQVLEFSQKDTLYRKTGGRVVPLWFRSAAAAAILAFAGIFYVFNNASQSEVGLSAGIPDSTGTVREVKTDSNQIGKPVEFEEVVQPQPLDLPLAQQEKKLRENISERVLTEELASLPSLNPAIESEFQLNTTYMAMRPEDLLLLQNINMAFQSNSSEQNNPASQQAFLLKRLRKFLKKQDISIEEPIEEIRRDGFTETGFKGLEKVSRGNIRVEREKTPNGSKVTGFTIGSLSYSRGAHK